MATHQKSNIKFLVISTSFFSPSLLTIGNSPKSLHPKCFFLKIFHFGKISPVKKKSFTQPHTCITHNKNGEVHSPKNSSSHFPSLFL
jgi:hypothetical protein